MWQGFGLAFVYGEEDITIAAQRDNSDILSVFERECVGFIAERR